MEKLISVSQLAKRIGITSRRIQQLIKELKEEGYADKLNHNKGKIDAIEFFIAWIKQNEEKAKKAKSKNSEIEKANLRLRLAQAEDAEINLKIKNDSLIARETSIKFITNIFGNVRNKLLSSPNRIAFQIFGSKTLPEAKMKVKKIVTEILNELSDPNYLFKKNKNN